MENVSALSQIHDTFECMCDSGNDLFPQRDTNLSQYGENNETATTPQKIQKTSRSNAAFFCVIFLHMCVNFTQKIQRMFHVFFLHTFYTHLRFKAMKMYVFFSLHKKHRKH